ncbi:hypothetical protein ACFQS7_14575 [Dankookia sp. GCM10030260]|uniref:hypothetical protein n=1 Tax=Dankookia sp. GCM10030260 TaxID=3273390 RepID=UPI003619D9E0
MARQTRDVSHGRIQEPCAVETTLRSVEAGCAVMGSTPAASPPQGFDIFTTGGRSWRAHACNGRGAAGLSPGRTLPT